MNDSIDKDSRLWAMLCHLSALCAYIGIPFGHIIGPLIVWLVQRDKYPFVNEQGKEALNFQISMSIYFGIAFLLMFVLIGIPLMVVIGLADLVLVVVAAIKANQGEAYRYPLSIRFIK